MLIKTLKAIRDFKYEMLPYFAHFGVGVLTSFTCVYMFFKVGLFASATIGLFASLLISILGEWIDNKITNNWNIMDIVATAFGGVIVRSLLQIAKGLL